MEYGFRVKEILHGNLDVQISSPVNSVPFY